VNIYIAQNRKEILSTYSGASKNGLVLSSCNCLSVEMKLVMVVLCNRADHYIFALWLLSFYLFLFPRLISAAGDWMSTIHPHMVWP